MIEDRNDRLSSGVLISFSGLRCGVSRFLSLIVSLGLLVALPGSEASESLSLRVGLNGDEFSFRVAGGDEQRSWLLQFSEGGMIWQDFLFLAPGFGNGSMSGVDVSPAALPVPNAEKGFFRVVEFREVDPFYQEYLAARARWRASGLTSYRYGFRWSTMIFWDGSIEVEEGLVSSYDRVQAFPPFFEEPPLYRTIDGLFDRIEQAWTEGAASISVTWHPEFGYPSSAGIDQSLLIADEEQYWTIGFLEPIR